jgi:hypothetical protein
VEDSAESQRGGAATQIATIHFPVILSEAGLDGLPAKRAKDL